MPRKPRIEYSGALYHVIARGNQKQRIFKDQSDFRHYLLLLTTYKNRTACRIYAYILMNNHVHLLIETGDIPLSKIMQGINQTYTLYFNRKYRTVGHLFQGRYKAILCDRETYLLGLLKYIHQNPLRARIAERLDAYPWSSHHAYTGKNNPWGLVDVDQVLRMFSERKGRARTRYREFMAEPDTLTRANVYAPIDQRIPGDDEFADRVLEQHDEQAALVRKQKKSLDELMRGIERRYELTASDMRSNYRTGDLTSARRVFAQAAFTLGHRRIDIARYLRKDPAAVTRHLRQEGYEKDVKLLLKGLDSE